MIKFRIIYDEYGQSGNRLFSYLDSIAWAIANDGKLIILFPDKILSNYDALLKCKNILLMRGGKVRLRIMRKLFYYNALIQRFYKTDFSHKLGFYAGWDLREANDWYPQVLPEIQRLFIPNDGIKAPVDATFQKLRSEGKTIIGVHIRRGDYRTAYGGKYWYEDDVYMSYMIQMQSLIPNSIFYISSNENICDELLQNFPTSEKPVNSAAGDIYALSQCEYIIGPPSTFNCWASFIGRVPLYTIFEPTKKITLDSFKVMRSDDVA